MKKALCPCPKVIIVSRPMPHRNGSASSETPKLGAEHPFASTGGSMKDDPYWDKMMDGIRRHRQELDAEFAASLEASEE